MMRDLDPVEGSEQAGFRPVIIVSRDSINASSSLVMTVPCTTYRQGRRIYPSQIIIKAPDGGLTQDSVALAEQLRTLAKSRLVRLRGTLGADTILKLNQVLLVALDLERL